WAGPNICTACLASLIVTLLKRIVFGFTGRFGATTAKSEVKPSLLLVSAWANAVSAALPRGPMMRSIWATSLPSPTSDSPTMSLFIVAMNHSSRVEHHARRQALPAKKLSLLTASEPRTGWPDRAVSPAGLNQPSHGEI